MNKFAFIFTKLLLLLLTVSVSACKPEPDITPELILAKESIEFTSEGATVKLAIRSNLDWTAVSSDAWCTVTPASGVPGTFQLNVSAEANPAAATREASLTITAGSLSKTVIISQGLTNSLTVSPGSFDLSADATEISLQVSAGLPVTAESSVDWMSLKSNSADGMTFVFSVGANTGSLSRTGTLTFNSGTLSKVVTVTQESQSTSIPDDATGMSSSALQLAANMHMGWNLGNTLEVPGSEVGWEIRWQLKR